MQTNLEVKAISKRNVDKLKNSTKVFGVKDNETKGYVEEAPYSTATNGLADPGNSQDKKGGDTPGSLVNHLTKGFDLTTGGDNVDQTARKTQQSYVVPGQKLYNISNPYSDEDAIKVDTSANIGQVSIY